jgi:hypothetical protein
MMRARASAARLLELRPVKRVLFIKFLLKIVYAKKYGAMRVLGSFPTKLLRFLWYFADQRKERRRCIHHKRI